MQDKLPVLVVCPFCKSKMEDITEEDYSSITENTKLYTCRKCQEEFIPNMKLKGRERKWQ